MKFVVALTCIVFGLYIPVVTEHGGILEIHYPSMLLEADLDGNIVLGAGSDGSVFLSPGEGGAILYRDFDLLEFIKMLRSLPPVWHTTGFSGKYSGGDEVNITLSALDPEGGHILYTIVAGALPPGIVLDHEEGVIRGFAPDENALYIVTIRATDNHHKHADAVFRFETTDTDRCAVFKPCKNGGKCIDKSGFYLCECVGVYGGHNCEEVCNETSLGVTANNKLIPDASMTAYRGRNDSLASDGRLNGKGWCGQMLSFLQIDLGGRKRIHRILTDGTTSSYEIQHSVVGMVFLYYTGINGSVPVTVSEKDYTLPVVLQTRFIRLLPVSYASGSDACLKVDILGCDVYY